MSTVEAIPMWISVPDVAVSPQPTPRPARPGEPEAASAPPAPMRVGLFSLRQIVDAAVSRAEAVAIRRALASTAGNKSHAARLLRTNYTTLHAKMKRYDISAREFLLAR
jgi:DNA-binding NtrC family response regulator